MIRVICALATMFVAGTYGSEQYGNSVTAAMIADRINVTDAQVFGILTGVICMGFVYLIVFWLLFLWLGHYLKTSGHS
jgi:hypothetical protein